MSVWKSMAASRVSTLVLAASPPSPSLRIFPSMRSSSARLLCATEAMAWQMSGRMGLRTPGFVLPSAERTSHSSDSDSAPELGIVKSN